MSVKKIEIKEEMNNELNSKKIDENLNLDEKKLFLHPYLRY